MTTPLGIQEQHANKDACARLLSCYGFDYKTTMTTAISTLFLRTS